MKRKTKNVNGERFSDLLSRLMKYSETSATYKFDYLSVPSAVQMLLRIFPHKYCSSSILNEKILRAFVTTIIPGADKNDVNLIKMYNDKFYPFSIYCGYFVFDLNRRSRRLFNNKDFDMLSLTEKTEVVQNALSGNELTRRLYKGAILIAQVSYYGAVYNEERGCPLIYFPGKNNGYSKKESTYPSSGRYFDRELSFDGHPW